MMNIVPHPHVAKLFGILVIAGQSKKKKKLRTNLKLLIFVI